MAENGKLPDSQLKEIPGGRLRRDVANSWLRLRQRIGKEANVWICPTSPRTAYRTYAEQQYFWTHQPPLAAVPGTSNHGWGTAVDVPQTRMAQLINQYGAEYGWQKRWSDAQSEWWHFNYSQSNDRHRGESVKRPPTGRAALTQTEKEMRDRLVRQRAKWRKNGRSWKGLGEQQDKARHARAWLKKRRQTIRKAAEGDTWQKGNRHARWEYIGKLIGES